MAKKPQRRVPQVPRSNIRSTPTVRETPVATRAPERPAPVAPSLAEEYSYVKRDLLRIATFGTLIFAGMAALKFVVGL